MTTSIFLYYQKSPILEIRGIAWDSDNILSSVDIRFLLYFKHKIKHITQLYIYFSTNITVIV